jgi:hypothetical protein
MGSAAVFHYKGDLGFADVARCRTHVEGKEATPT